MKTGLPQRPTIRVPVSAEIVGDIEVVPARIQLKERAPRESFSTRINVRSRTRHHFSIHSIAVSDSGRMQVSVSPRAMTPAEGEGYVLDVSGITPGSSGPIGATIQLHIKSNGSRHDVSIPLYGFTEALSGRLPRDD